MKGWVMSKPGVCTHLVYCPGHPGLAAPAYPYDHLQRCTSNISGILMSGETCRPFVVSTPQCVSVEVPADPGMSEGAGVPGPWGDFPPSAHGTGCGVHAQFVNPDPMPKGFRINLRTRDV